MLLKVALAVAWIALLTNCALIMQFLAQILCPYEGQGVALAIALLVGWATSGRCLRALYR